MLVASLVVSPPAKADASFGLFYSNLSRHGHWNVSASFGRVWQPAVYHSSWHPYYDGHWAYTDLGWMWISGYAWGPIAYHYGTWAFDPFLGWVWLPGYAWAPSWVVFRQGPGYVGWAPVPPSFSVGVSFVDVDPGCYLFVPTRSFAGVRVRSVAVPATQTRRIVSRTTAIRNSIRVENDIVVNRGPSAAAIQRAAGRPIKAIAAERIAGRERIRREDVRVSPSRVRRVNAAEMMSARTALPVAQESRKAGALERSVRRESVGRHETAAAPRVRSSRTETTRPSVQRTPAPVRSRVHNPTDQGARVAAGPSADRGEAATPKPKGASARGNGQGRGKVK